MRSHLASSERLGDVRVDVTEVTVGSWALQVTVGVGGRPGGRALSLLSLLFEHFKHGGPGFVVPKS